MINELDHNLTPAELGQIAVGGGLEPGLAAMHDEAVFRDFMTGGRRCHAFAPGRTELAGNHVDHQGGVVLAATISQGIHGEACENDLGLIRVMSDGFPTFSVDLGVLHGEDLPLTDMFGTSKSLVAGMVSVLEGRASTPVRGFDVRVKSDLPAGGGLSSSAAFELMIGALLNTMFFEGQFTPLDLALAAQETESRFFGKPCGLMDQATIAFGGVIQIDFTGEQPAVEPVDFDFASAGLSIVLVDVHADHSAATPEYASIPRDMNAAARLCGAERLGEVDEDHLMARLFDIRHLLGDRAALRSLHYVREVHLVRTRAHALATGDVAAYCQATAFSAASSAQYLQNVSELGTSQQPAMLALAVADYILDRMAAEHKTDGGPALQGAWPRGVARIHGGGFGGSIQIYLPSERACAFAEHMDTLLGPGSSTILTITDKGAHASWL